MKSVNEVVLILAEAPMIQRVENWASMNDLKVGPIPVMKKGIPLSLEVIDDPFDQLSFRLTDKTVRKGDAIIGYWSYEPVASAQEGKTVKIIQPIGY